MKKACVHLVTEGFNTNSCRTGHMHVQLAGREAGWLSPPQSHYFFTERANELRHSSTGSGKTYSKKNIGNIQTHILAVCTLQKQCIELCFQVIFTCIRQYRSTSQCNAYNRKTSCKHYINACGNADIWING